jgi:hypothetical protein
MLNFKLVLNRRNFTSAKARDAQISSVVQTGHFLKDTGKLHSKSTFLPKTIDQRLSSQASLKNRDVSRWCSFFSLKNCDMSLT